MSESEIRVLPSPVQGPALRAGYPVWSASYGPVEVRFVGKGPRAEKGIRGRARVLEAVEGRSLGVSGLQQVHSARVVEAETGLCGEGDALWTERPGLALSVVTADCVPVVLAGPRGEGDGRWRVAAVHAGWRGIVAGVVTGAVRVLGVGPSIRAWIGPAIGACCYEVGEDVAGEVAAVAGAECVVPRSGARPHLDLVAAVRSRLADSGVPTPRVVLRCTRCDEQALWSYRREGRGAGRNYAYVWMTG